VIELRNKVLTNNEYNLINRKNEVTGKIKLTIKFVENINSYNVGFSGVNINSNMNTNNMYTGNNNMYTGNNNTFSSVNNNMYNSNVVSNSGGVSYSSHSITSNLNVVPQSGNQK
jgi:hypothetical protein